MKNYKKDVIIPGLFRLQGFVNFKTANWHNCIERECPLFKICEKSFEDRQEVDCIYPVEQVNYEYEEQEINEKNFSAYAHNSTGNLFIADILKHFRGTSTPSLAFNYGVASTRFNDVGEPNAATTLAADAREIGRHVTVNSGTDPNCVSTITFSTSEGNVLSTTITGTPASTTTFDIVSATGLAVNDCVAITQTAPLGTVRRKITGLAGTTVTLTDPLDAIPVSGNAFIQEWTRVYLVTNGTGASLSGTMASVIPYSYQKTSSSSKAIYFTLRIKGT